jgi:MFS transporter, DHA1 family, tetracycline resistance protein
MVSSRTKSLLVVFLTLFLDQLGYAASLPLFPVLLLNPQFGPFSFDASETIRYVYLALLIVAFPCAQLLGAPFFGDYADQHGRKKALIWTIGGTIFGNLLTTWAIAYSHYILLLLSRSLTGFFAGNLAVCMAIIADMHYGKKKRSKNFGYVAAALGVSWILAIYWGAVVATTPTLFFASLSLFACFCLFIALFFFRETHTAPHIQHGVQELHRVLHVLASKQMRTLFLTLVLWFFGFFMAVQWAVPISVDKFHATPSLVFKLLIAVACSWTLGSFLVHTWATTHFSSWKIGLWSLFGISLLYFYGGVTNFFLYFALALALSGFFAALIWSANLSLISLAASSNHQGKTLGLVFATLSLAQGIGPLLGGIAAGFSLETLFFTSSLLTFCGFLSLLLYILRRKNKLSTT